MNTIVSPAAPSVAFELLVLSATMVYSTLSFPFPATNTLFHA